MFIICGAQDTILSLYAKFYAVMATLNFTCYVSLDQGSTVYPPPPPKKQQQQQIGHPQKISLFYILNLKRPVNA